MTTRANPVLRASPEAIAAMNVKLREAERVEAERLAAVKAAEPPKPVLTVVPSVPRPTPPAAPAPPPRRPQLIWAAEVPIVLPDDLASLTAEQQERVGQAQRAVARLAKRQPGHAAALALKLEAFLGTTDSDRTATWAPIRSLVGSLGTPNLAKDMREQATKRWRRDRAGDGWRDKPLAPPRASGMGAGGAKKRDVKFSDGPTPERAKKSKLVEQPIPSVSTEKPKGDRAWNEDALPPPKTILVGRAMKDESNEAKARLTRFTRLEAAHINAGVRLAEDWEKSALEPRMTANLLATGGGSSDDAWATGKSLSTMEARTRIHKAFRALTLIGGLDVAHVVHAVIIRGEAATVAASATYTDKPRASSHVAANLKAGLNILVQHNKTADKEAAEARAKRAARETA